MECSCQLADPAQCDCLNDCVTHSIIQEEMLQDHSRVAHTVLTHVAVLVLIFIY